MDPGGGVLPLAFPGNRAPARSPASTGQCPRTGWTGGAATRPVHADITSEQDSPAMPQLSPFFLTATYVTLIQYLSCSCPDDRLVISKYPHSVDSRDDALQLIEIPG